MSCAIHSPVLPQGKGVRVNGMQIPRDLIAREVQYHPAKNPTEAWKAAAQSLVIREMLLQEARRLNVAAQPQSDGNGRSETDDEAMIRGLIAQEVQTPTPDEDACRRYYDHNRARFRSPDIYEASHILFAATRADKQTYETQQAAAQAVLALLRHEPAQFAEFAAAHSACPSAAQGGNLGQITSGQTTPEFERALLDMAPGTISEAPVATRYGFHIIRLDRRIDGADVPFDLVAERIADYLKESVERRATAQYIARLAERADIEGITLTSADEFRVH